MVAVVQLVEHQVVILGVAGSSPVSHPAGGRVFLPSHHLRFSELLHPYRAAAKPGTTSNRASLPFLQPRECNTHRGS